MPRHSCCEVGVISQLIYTSKFYKQRKKGRLFTNLSFFVMCVQQSWTTLAGVSPVTVIASEPCS